MSDTEEPRAATCPKCGNDRASWRIRREGRPGHPTVHEFYWTCKECGHGWTESLPTDGQRDWGESSETRAGR